MVRISQNKTWAGTNILENLQYVITKWLEMHIWSEITAGFNAVFAFHFAVKTGNTQEAENREAMSVIYLLANNFHCYNKY